MNICINDLQKADCFSSIFQNLKPLTDSINISFSDDQMYIQSMDSTHITLFEITVPAAWFCEYSKDSPASTVIGINTNALSRILNSRDKSQTIQIIFSEDSSDALNIEMRSKEKNIFDKSFEVPLLDLESEFMQIPALEYQAEMSIPSSKFAGIITQLKLFGTSMDIECSETNIRLCAKDAAEGKMSVNISIDDISYFAIDAGANLKMSYNLRCMHLICQFCKISENVDLRIHSDHPLRVDYDIGNGGMIRFFLAPMIAPDE
jgi:proliferating cell nuclear antigen